MAASNNAILKTMLNAMKKMAVKMNKMENLQIQIARQVKAYVEYMKSVDHAFDLVEEEPVSPASSIHYGDTESGDEEEEVTATGGEDDVGDVD